MKRICCHLIAAAVAVVVTEHSLAATVTIDGSETNQVIEGFGVNINSWGWTNQELNPVIDGLIDGAGMMLSTDSTSSIGTGLTFLKSSNPRSVHQFFCCSFTNAEYSLKTLELLVRTAC